jgi:hypothetical protein
VIIEERIKRFKQLADKMEYSIELYKSIMGNKSSEELINQKRELFENRTKIENSFKEALLYSGDENKREDFLKSIDLIIKKIGTDYIKVIKNLDEDNLKIGTGWLLSIIEKTRTTILKHLPSYF